MCGRYSLIADLGELARRFGFDGDWDHFEPRYNIAPTQQVLTVAGGEKRRAGLMRWGLIPSWAKKPLHRQPNDQCQGGDDYVKVSRSAMRCGVGGVSSSLTVSTSGRGPAGPKGPCASSCGHGSPSPSPGCGRCGGTRTATASLRALSSPPRPTTCSGPSTTGCRSSFPGTWRSSGWMPASTTRSARQRAGPLSGRGDGRLRGLHSRQLRSQRRPGDH